MSPADRRQDAGVGAERVALALCADTNVLGSLHVCLLTALESSPAATAFDVFLFTPPRFPPQEIAALENTLRLTGRGFTLQHVDRDLGELQGFRGLHGVNISHLKWLIPELLPGLRRLILLDTDLIVRADLRRLWSMPLGERPVAAVQLGTVEYSCDTEFLLSLGAGLDDPYFNAGVLLVDVERWVAERWTDAFRRFAQQHGTKLRAAEQTVYNALLAPIGGIAGADAAFNHPLFADAPADPMTEPRVYHLLGAPKPWDPFGRLLNSHAPVYFRELGRTTYGEAPPQPLRRRMTRVYRLSRAYLIGIRTRLLRLAGA